MARDKHLSPEAQEFVSRWEAVHPIAAFVASFPVSELATIDLGWASNPAGCGVLLGKVILASIGDRAAVDELKEKYGATDENIAGIKTRIRKSRHEKDALKQAADFCLSHAKCIGNLLINLYLGDRLTDLGTRLTESLVEPARGDLSGLPADLDEILTNATSCLRAIEALWTLTHPYFHRIAPIPVEVAARIRQTIAQSISKLRSLLPSLSLELAAACSHTPKIGGASQPSIHHAVKSLGCDVLDLIALTGTDTGQLIFASIPTPFPTITTENTKPTQALGKALNEHFPRSQVSIAALQQEVATIFLSRNLVGDGLVQGSLNKSQQAEAVSPKTALKPQYQRALDLIRSLPEPTKGQTIASKLGIRLTTFQKYYVSALKPFGLRNDRNGYFIDESQASAS